MSVENIEQQLSEAIDEQDFHQVEELLKSGLSPNIIQKISEDSDSIYTPLLEAIDSIVDEDASYAILKKLLEYGAFVNLPNEDGQCNPISHAVLGNSIKLIKVFLLLGSDPNVRNSGFVLPLYEAIIENWLNSAELLLNYGAQATMNIYGTPICGCSPLQYAAKELMVEAIEKLLDYGADVAVLDSLYENAQEYLPQKTSTNHDAWDLVNNLVDPHNPPYLKLGEKDNNRYIIYENKLVTESMTPTSMPFTKPHIHLLTDKQKHPNKKYLYTDNKIDTFVYWCYTKSLLNEPTMKALKKYLSIVGTDTYTTLSNLVKDLTGGKLTVDYFNEEGKAFATHYLTVTHWWYNLHTDFNRLYQDEGVKLPRAIQSQEEFDTLLKLLDIRHEQYQSGKHFNANQNKAELQALIAGKEPPKREVDLSVLLKDEEDTLPEDFMK